MDVSKAPATSSSSSRLALVVAVLAIGVGGFLRFYHLDELGISHWDAGSYTAGPLQVGPYGRRPILPYYAPPLLPSLIGWSFSLFGTKDQVALALAATLGTLTLLAAFRLGSELVGRRAAAIGTAILASMEYQILYSRQPLTEGPYLLFFILAIHQLAIGWRTSRWQAYVLGGVWSGAALLTKYHGFFPLIVLGIVAVLTAIGAGRTTPSLRPIRRSVAGLLIASVALFLPAIGLAYQIHDTVGFASFRANRQQWLPVLGWYLLPQTASYLWSCLTAWIDPLALATGLCGLVFLAYRRRPGDLWLLAWTTLFVGTLPLYKNYPRLPLPLTVPLALASGAMLSSILNRLQPTKSLVLLPLSAAALAIVGTSWSWGSLQISDRGYAEAAAILRADPVDEGVDLLVTQHALLFYLHDHSRAVITYDEDEAAIRLASGTFRYLVADLRTLHAPAFREYLASSPPELVVVATLPNPLPPTTLVNCAGFSALRDTDEVRRRELDTIRVYRRVER